MLEGAKIALEIIPPLGNGTTRRIVLLICCFYFFFGGRVLLVCDCGFFRYGLLLKFCLFLLLSKQLSFMLPPISQSFASFNELIGLFFDLLLDHGFTGHNRGILSDDQHFVIGVNLLNNFGQTGARLSNARPIDGSASQFVRQDLGHGFRQDGRRTLENTDSGCQGIANDENAKWGLFVVD